MNHYMHLIGQKAKKAVLKKINTKTKNKVLKKYALLLNKEKNSILKANIKDVKLALKNSLKDISEYFGHKIDISVSNNGKGKISIPFHSEEDFNRIKNLLK